MHRSNNRGISSIIGTVLMVSLVILLAGVVAITATTIGSGLPEKPDFREQVSDQSPPVDEYSFAVQRTTHNGSDAIQLTYTGESPLKITEINGSTRQIQSVENAIRIYVDGSRVYDYEKLRTYLERKRNGKNPSDLKILSGVKPVPGLTNPSRIGEKIENGNTLGLVETSDSVIEPGDTVRITIVTSAGEEITLTKTQI